MKRTRILSTLIAALALLTTSCGTSDYLESLQLTSSGGSSGGTFFNLAGVDGTLQLQVNAVYHSGKQIDVTTSSTWTVTPVGCATTADNATYLCQVDPATGQPNGSQPPYALPPYGPNTVPINKTGLMTGIVAMCTWTDAINTTITPNAPYNPAQWVYTGYYQVTATYRNFTSQPVGVGVGVTVSDDFAGCGPS